MTVNDPNLVDWLTLFAAAASTILGTFITIWSIIRSDRDRFYLHIDWEWFGPNREYEELPFVYIQNRSVNPIVISDISWYRGALFRKPTFGTALYWLDPSELSFPYTVEPGELKKLVLSELGAKRNFEKL